MCTNRRRQPESHGAHAARGDERTRMTHAAILGRPHLMLPHTRAYDGLSAGEFIEHLDDLVGLNQVAVVVIIEPVDGFQFYDMFDPFRKVFFKVFAMSQEVQQGLPRATDMRPVGRPDFPNFRCVNVNMCDVSGIRGKIIDFSRDTVVEARSDRDHEVAVLYRVVGIGCTMHAQHMEGELVGEIHAADPHERGHHRDLEAFGEFPQFLGGLGVDHAAAGINERTRALFKHFEERGGCRLRNARRVQGGHTFLVAPERQVPLALERADGVLHILRYVNDDRARSAAPGQLERRPHGVFEPVGVFAEKDMFRACTHHIKYGRFLERIRTDGCTGHLAANQHHRDRIGHAVANRRDGIGRAGARRDHHHTDLAAGTGIARRHESGALFVCRHNQADLILEVVGFVVPEDGVVCG